MRLQRALVLRLVALSCTLCSLATLAGCAREPAATTASLAWLAGCWEGKAEGAVVDERWGTPSGGTVLGTERVVKDGQTLFTEFMVVREDEGGLVLTVHPEGQRPVAFRSQQLGKTDVIFANAAHDFPQRIVYHRRGGTLFVRAEGEERGEKRELRYKLRRIGCD